MKAYRILIESKSAADFICDKMREAELSFYTTSPWLIEKTNIKGFPVYSLEEHVPIDRMPTIGKLGYAIAEFLSDKISNEYLNFFFSGRPLLGIIQKTFFVLAYKAYLMKIWVEGRPDRCYDIIVGNPMLREVNSFDLFVGRFDTLFSAIALEAKNEGWNACELFNFSSREDGREHLDKMMAVGQSLEERFFSLVNMPLNSLRYKLMKKRSRTKGSHNNDRKGKGKAIILKDCELQEETTPLLKLYGFDIAFEDLSWLKKRIKPKKVDLNEETFIDEALSECLLLCNEMDLEPDLLQRAVLRIVIRRLNQAIVYAKPLWDVIQGHFDTLLDSGSKKEKRPVIILTNGLTSPGERLIFQYAKNRKIPLFAFEHGITDGLSHLTRFQGKYSGINESHRKVFLTPCALNHQKRLGYYKSDGFVSGSPDVIKKIRFRAFQKLAARFMLGVKLKERIILYATLATQNNMIYGPHGQNDYMYYKITKQVIQEVFASIKDTCMLKLYPTNRYLDPDPFSGLVLLPNNTKTIQYFEFRYLRSLTDIIICDSPQSTLGWVWSARVPLIFLDLPSNPLLPEVAEAFDKAILRINCSEDGWVEEVNKLLTIPHKELLKIWKEKEPIRRQVEEKYIFGPPGNSGKRAAKFIIEETRKWYEEKDTSGELR